MSRSPDSAAPGIETRGPSDRCSADRRRRPELERLEDLVLLVDPHRGEHQWQRARFARPGDP